MSRPPVPSWTPAVALPEVHRWTGRVTDETLASLPNTPAVLLYLDDADRPVQLMTTQHLRRSCQSRLSLPGEPQRGKADLAAVVRGVRWRPVHCPFEARWWHYGVARELNPRNYRGELGFGPAWFLHVDWDAPVPDIRVTREVWQRSGDYAGPWPTRKAAQEALEGLWDLFDLCRYPEQVQRAPGGQRCAYAEMGRCDAPCDGSVPLEHYAGRCRAAWRFAGGEVVPWMSEAVEQMKAAAAEQRYEHAAQLKQQIEFARRWQRRWAGAVRPMDRQRWLLGLPVARRRAWKFFLFRAGALADGPVLQQRHLERDLPQWLTAVASSPPVLPEALVRMEQTWLWAHLMFNREAKSALLDWLPDNVDAQAVGRRLGNRSRELRSAQGRTTMPEDNTPAAGENAAE